MIFRILLLVLPVLAGGAAAAAPAVTFSRDIAPLLQQHCQECHRPDGGAPFTLSKYEHVFSRRTKILEAVEKRYMPPWKAVPGYGDLAGERRRYLPLLQRGDLVRGRPLLHRRRGRAW